MLAAQATRRAIVALEGDKNIFKEVLDPLQKTAAVPHAVAPSEVTDLTEDDEVLPEEDAVDLCE